MVLVTRPAPDFTAAAVLGNGEIVENFNFKQHTNGKATVLFFWPMDFTFVCPSELIAFDKRYEEFQKRGVEVVGVSFDSEFVHNAKVIDQEDLFALREIIRQLLLILVDFGYARPNADFKSLKKVVDYST